MKLEELSAILGADLIGDACFFCKNIASTIHPKKDSIVSILNIKNLSKDVLKNSGAILTNPDIAKSIKVKTNLLVVDDIESAFVKLLNLYKFNPSTPNLVSKSSIFFTKNKPLFLGKNVSIGKNPNFGANVVIEDNVVIGNNVCLGHNTVICYGSIIGNNVHIDHGCVIGSEGFGNIRDQDNIWQHMPHLGSVIIDDKCSIGANCCIDRGTIDNTVIKKYVVIDNHVHIAHNVFIGEKTAIAANTGIAGSCVIGKRNMIGGMVGMVDHIRTVDDVVISATSTVHKNLTKPGVYTGIMPISLHTSWKRIAFWISKLDKIAKILNIKKI